MFRTFVIHFTTMDEKSAFSLFLPQFDVVSDLLLNRRTTTLNLFVDFTINAVSILAR